MWVYGENKDILAAEVVLLWFVWLLQTKLEKLLKRAKLYYF